MLNLPIVRSMPVRFCPSKETLAVLNERQWICSYSGGKDSTSLVTWIECLRRIGMIKCETPRLVMSDTRIEYPFLSGIADRLISILATSGWQCEIVTPRINDRLYCQIFGRGLPPVHPAQRRRMRWCTRSTKTDPMSRFGRTLGGDIIQLTGVRWGESETRDGKLSLGGCAAGGECGLPEPGEGKYAPLITWKTCKVIEWLSGETDGVSETISDLLPLMQELVSVYEVKKSQGGWFGVQPKVTALRFGCIGCPAISKEKITVSKQGREHPQWTHLARIYGIWQELYLMKNRLIRLNDRLPKRPASRLHASMAKYGMGPIRMEARKRYFAELLDIQKQAGVTLTTAEDEAFIRNCWERKVYPRGWSEADEATVAPPEPDCLFQP